MSTSKDLSAQQGRKRRLHVVTNTHWDREHRHGFQETRFKLVEAVDKLIEIMEADAEFKYFTFDGQSVMLEDYLEIKPFMKERLKSLIKDGRILVGPWYTLPDMPPLTGECIVRNLLAGDRYCRQFGAKMNFGYSIFSFGQIAQLPQIYKGFGIDEMIVYKGYSPEVIKQSEFIWSAPDGTKILASRLGPWFRINFLFCFTIPVILGGDARKPGWKVGFTDGTKLAHLIDNEFRKNHAVELEQDIRIRKEKIAEAIEDTLESLEGTVAESAFVAFDGVDFSSPVKEVPEAISEANKIAPADLEIIHSNVVDYFKELKEEIDIDSLFNYTGELRYGPVGRTHCECISTNIELKLKNHKAEVSLLNYAEPFSVFDALNGGVYPYDILSKAWKYLLKSHAHDSIHGAGVPKIKSDTLWRLSQAQEIADGVSRRAFEGIMAKINTDSFDDDEILITIFNPTQYKRDEVINVKIDLPQDEHVADYHVETMDGKKVPMYEYNSREMTACSINAENRPKAVYCRRVDVDLFVENLPPVGYKTLKLKRVKGTRRPARLLFANPVNPYNPIGTAPNTLDNRLLRVQINANGTVDVTDLQTGFTAKGLNLFIDTGCSGEIWIHRTPPADRIVTTIGSNARISLVRNSSLSATFRVEVVLDIPESLTQDEKARSPHTIPTKISTEITLSKGSKRVDLKVAFENRCKDHKLTVSFPTGIKTQHCYSQCPFEIRQRPIDCATEDNGKLGSDILRHPMGGFLDISDGSKGLALFAKGAKEFETKYYDDGIAACELTLLRAVTQTFPVDASAFLYFEDELTQSIGQHQFEYSLLLHNGDYFKGDVIAQSGIYAQPLVAGQFGKGKKGTLPSELSFMKSDNHNIIINCIKRAEDSDETIVRLTNPTDKTIKNKLEFHNNIKKAFRTNMNEEKIEEITLISDNALALKIPPYRIVTVCLSFDTK